MDRQEDNLSRMPMWKSYLYHLQQQAPKPKRIVCHREILNKPPCYGKEYHGAISREDADFMLTIGGEGSYLIRESQRAPGQYTLAIRFDGVTKNFKLYFDSQHYVGEKRFETVQDLVADGLITFYLESKAADYIAALSSQSNYAESPYVAYNTQKKWQMASSSGLRRTPRLGTSSAAAGGQVASNSSAAGPAAHAPVAATTGEAGTGGSRLSSEAGTTTIGGSGSAELAPGSSALRALRGANLPLEKSRLSQIAEAKRAAGEGGGAGGQRRTPPPASSSKISMHDKGAPPVVQQPFPGTPQFGKQHRTHVVSQVSSPPSSSSSSSSAAPSHRANMLQSSLSSDITDGRVTSSTNTEGPMLEELQFSTPPSSPPLGGLHDVGGGKGGQPNVKASSVTWCNDYLEVMGCEKTHNFRLYTFKGPHWCDYCANFLWGLIAQGVKCQDCGFNAHKKCSEKVPNDCMPDMKYVKRMFGIDLTTIVKAQSTLIPVVVELCVKEIEDRGVESEGLYRVAGFHDDVEAIKMSFDKDGEFTDISVDRYDDLNTIASVLKLYFRLLPIPLITFDIYFKVIDIVRRDDITTEKEYDMIKHCLALLPPAHYHTLKYLIGHLHRVTEHQQQNMMSAENLAIVFAPTLLRSPETDPLFSLSAVKYERELIELLILHHKQLFD